MENISLDFRARDCDKSYLRKVPKYLGLMSQTRVPYKFSCYQTLSMKLIGLMHLNANARMSASTIWQVRMLQQ